MTATIPDTILDIDLTDGNFYADRQHLTRGLPLDAGQPAGVSRSQWTGRRATYQAILDAERNPELFSNTGGIRPDQPGMPYMIDMDDPVTPVAAQARQRRLYPQAGQGERYRRIGPGCATP